MGMENIRWFHSIDLGDATTRGSKNAFDLKWEADYYFRGDMLKDKTVLDIGAWDGYMSFEAERRGASRVVATDYFCWSGAGWGTKAGFDYARSALNSKVESVEVDVFDLDPARLGTFDVVLFPGVLYHLTDPWGGLKRAADMTHDLLIVETATALNNVPEPAMRYYVGKTLNGDPTNFWAPNEPCLRDMLVEMGFQNIETVVRRVNNGERLIAHAYRKPIVR